MNAAYDFVEQAADRMLVSPIQCFALWQHRSGCLTESLRLWTDNALVVLYPECDGESDKTRHRCCPPYNLMASHILPELVEEHEERRFDRPQAENIQEGYGSCSVKVGV